MSVKNSRYATLIGTHQPIMLRHKTELFASVVLFSNGQIALPSMGLLAPDHLRQDISPFTIGAVSGNGIIKINLLLHAFPVVTAKEKNVISIAFRHRSVHDGHIVEVLQVNGLDGTC